MSKDRNKSLYKKKRSSKSNDTRDLNGSLVELHLGKWEDWLGELKKVASTIPASSKDKSKNGFDLILTDPPYSLKRSTITHTNRKSINVNEGVGWDVLDLGWVKPITDLLNDEGQVLAFCTLEAIGDYKRIMEEAGLTYKTCITVHRSNPGVVHRNTYLSSCEACVWAVKGKKYYFKEWDNKGLIDVHNFKHGPICMGKQRLKHPAQKPLWLIEELLLQHSRPSDYVLDPFLGVGTTAEACARHSRVCLGIEKSEDYILQARERIRSKMKIEDLDNINLPWFYTLENSV